MSDLIITPWKPSHTTWLRQALFNYLQLTYDEGALLIPSEANVNILINQGLSLAKRYDPCLIASLDSKPIAFTLWGRFPSPLGTRKFCEAIGTYVDPAHRNKGISKEIRKAALDLAKSRGYEIVVGTAYTQDKAEITRKVGFKIRGTLLYYHL